MNNSVGEKIASLGLVEKAQLLTALRGSERGLSIEDIRRLDKIIEALTRSLMRDLEPQEVPV